MAYKKQINIKNQEKMTQTSPIKAISYQSVTLLALIILSVACNDLTPATTQMRPKHTILATRMFERILATSQTTKRMWSPSSWLGRLLQTETTEDGNFYSCYFKVTDNADNTTDYYSTIFIESAGTDTDEEIRIIILIFDNEFEFNSPGQRFSFSVPVIERSNFGSLINYTWNSDLTEYQTFTNLGSFGKIENKRNIKMRYTFVPEDFGLFYSDFHKELEINKVLSETGVDYTGINNYKIVGSIQSSSQIVSILVYIWLIICATIICPAKFNKDEFDLDYNMDNVMEIEQQSETDAISNFPSPEIQHIPNKVKILDNDDVLKEEFSSSGEENKIEEVVPIPMKKTKKRGKGGKKKQKKGRRLAKNSKKKGKKKKKVEESEAQQEGVVQEVKEPENTPPQVKKASENQKIENKTSFHPNLAEKESLNGSTNQGNNSNGEDSSYYDHSDLDSEEYETVETYWAILIWNLPMDYTQWILIFELIAHIRVMIEYPTNLYNAPTISLLIILLILSTCQKNKKLYQKGGRNPHLGTRREKLFRWIIIGVGIALTLVGVLYFTVSISLLHPLFYFTVALDFSIYTNQEKISKRIGLLIAELWLFSHLNFGGSFFILYSRKNLKLYPINPMMTIFILVPLFVAAILVIAKLFLHEKFTKYALIIVGGNGSKNKVLTPDKSAKTSNNDLGSFMHKEHIHDIPSISNDDSNTFSINGKIQNMRKNNLNKMNSLRQGSEHTVVRIHKLPPKSRLSNLGNKRSQFKKITEEPIEDKLVSTDRKLISNKNGQEAVDLVKKDRKRGKDKAKKVKESTRKKKSKKSKKK